MAEYFNKYYKVPNESFAVISGPCHAEEVAMERLSYLTIACQDQDQAKKVGECLKSRYIRVKISDDIIGTEYAAMLKNIFSIDYSDGLNLDIKVSIKNDSFINNLLFVTTLKLIGTVLKIYWS